MELRIIYTGEDVQVLGSGTISKETQEAAITSDLKRIINRYFDVVGITCEIREVSDEGEEE